MNDGNFHEKGEGEDKCEGKFGPLIGVIIIVILIMIGGFYFWRIATDKYIHSTDNNTTFKTSYGDTKTEQNDLLHNS